MRIYLEPKALNAIPIHAVATPLRRAFLDAVVTTITTLVRPGTSVPWTLVDQIATRMLDEPAFALGRRHPDQLEVRSRLADLDASAEPSPAANELPGAGAGIAARDGGGEHHGLDPIPKASASDQVDAPSQTDDGSLGAEPLPDERGQG